MAAIIRAWLRPTLQLASGKRSILIPMSTNGEHRYVYDASKPGHDIAPHAFYKSPDEDLFLDLHSHPYAWSFPNSIWENLPWLGATAMGRGQPAADEAWSRDPRASGACHGVLATTPDGKHEYLYYGAKRGLPPRAFGGSLEQTMNSLTNTPKIYSPLK